VALQRLKLLSFALVHRSQSPCSTTSSRFQIAF
jgi:hypothetical protein